MIVYSSNKLDFCADVLSGRVEDKLQGLMKVKTGRSVGPAEVSSWRNSLQYMNSVLQDADIPNDAGIAIEYQLPSTAKRVDFIITGKSPDERDSMVIIELKQWSDAKATDKPSIVKTRFFAGEQEVAHPSYQAWSYAQFLKDFNATIEEESIAVSPCAYLHNYERDGIIDDDRYKDDIERAPVFFRTDLLKLREFIKAWVKFGDKKELMYRIDNGKIRPSKSLSNHLVSLLKGNKDFILIDDQKIAFESAINRAIASGQKKKVVIIEGGPGTGKSVVAINILVELLKRGKNAQYVTKNAAPRAVYEAKLSGHFKKTQISNLFVGSGGYTEAKENTFDALVVDEAHRLNERSGLFKNLGENQIEEIIAAAKCAIFFVDENQKVTIHDIGTKDEILNWAMKVNAEVTEYELASQFRCAGSDGYISWLDNTLQIRETANVKLEDPNYEFRIFDDPSELLRQIKMKNKSDGSSRIVAGYCWDWISKKEEDAYDIIIGKFKMRWNLASDGSLWIISESSIEEAGCIHTCQGLELNYVGVIIGPDFIVRDGVVETRSEFRSKMDSSLKGIKALSKTNPTRARKLSETIIKNTYRTLMTRGMKGCFIYSEDRETREYFNSCLGATLSIDPVTAKKVAAPKKPYRS